jgi:hypothetical protein
MLHRSSLAAILLLLSTSAWATMFATTGGAGAGPGSLYTMSQTTGAVALVGTPNFGTPGEPVMLGLPAVDFRYDGKLFAATGFDSTLGNMLVELDPASGALVRVIGAISGDISDVRDIAIKPGTSEIFATSWNGILYTIDILTGNPTPVGGTIDDGPIAFAANGTLYMAQMNPRQAAGLYTLDLTTGAATPVAPLQHYYMGLGRGPDGMLYAADFEGNRQWGPAGGTNGDIYRIDPATGAETYLGSNPTYMIHDIAFNDATSLPAPSLSGWGLAVLALLVAAIGARRLFA